MPVTTRIVINFVVGDPYKSSFATVTGMGGTNLFLGGGDNPQYESQVTQLGFSRHAQAIAFEPADAARRD